MAFTKKTIRDVDVDGKRVLVRVDFNVPVKDGVVGDTTRIKAALPTIKYLVDHNAKVILMSHLGRPKGDGPEPAFSLAPVAAKLAELSGLDVTFVDDTYGEKAAAAVAALEPGKILVLENVRFDKREKKNDPEIAKTLASYGDIFVLDAFGTAHRAQGSVVGPAAYIPAVAGFLLEKEVSTLGGLFSDPKRPFVAILGGSKVSDKIGVIDRLLDTADTVIVGGGMAYTFAKAQGGKIGTSLCEDDWCDRALEMVEKAKKNGVEFLLPVDNVIADAFAEDANTDQADTGMIPDGWMGLDIGPKTEKLYADAIANAQTVFWNGPCGVIEMAKFALGTKAIAEAIAANQDCDSVIGCGDSVAAVNKFGLADKMTFISTGGGASMQLVEGKPLPEWRR